MLMRVAEVKVRTQFKAGFRYARVGAILADLQQAGSDQGVLDWFSAVEEPVEATSAPRAKRMVVMDALNRRYECESVRLGSTAMATNGAEAAVWATKLDRRSPRYTMVWNEMPTIGA
ncbi:MAG: DUF4113 domain-containing protein [Aquabacterium sp.]|uniref:DUF4113 domain-containing protein n=1 Tax=Aquabacterium sp. TaxID=1872578 RepID=UPI0012104E8E|nr:DUF4113 domain-containing protein [Aquabacterium sp.]TAK94923.1 MAG: DUF4113 domain-containing protein [Aquabacterium sp.]